MLKLKSSTGYIIANSRKDVELAKLCNLCSYIIMEDSNYIHIWDALPDRWRYSKYVVYGEEKDFDFETRGIDAYLSFYNYCGKEEVEHMKSVLPIIPLWESTEQMHYFNFDYVGEKIYQDIYEFDANSSFTYGVLQLSGDFNILKEYMQKLYKEKENAPNKIVRSKYKNMQNYLIGYFARIKEFVALRSEIIKGSNSNIITKMMDINDAGGTVYLSNTDSIVTDKIGADVMQKHLGTGIGEFKLSEKTDRLCYLSSNAYQLGNKLVYSGVKYFARKHTDLFKEEYGQQYGSLIEGFNYTTYTENGIEYKLCEVKGGTIIVKVFNKLGENIKTYKYRLVE